MNFSWFTLYNNIEINDIIPPIAASIDFIQGYSKLRSVSKILIIALLLIVF